MTHRHPGRYRLPAPADAIARGAHPGRDIRRARSSRQERVPGNTGSLLEHAGYRHIRLGRLAAPVEAEVWQIVTDGAAGTSGSTNASRIRNFQLRILSGMRGNQAAVREALRWLGADQAEMAASRDRTGQVFLSPDHFGNVIEVLGPPLAVKTTGPPPSDRGSGPLTRLTYQLPLWPGLVFYLQGIPQAPILTDGGFARPPQAPPAVPDGWDDLRPWAWLRGEVLQRFGPPVGQGDNWFPYEEFKFQIHDASGSSRQFWAIFSWNLLQHVEWA